MLSGFALDVFTYALVCFVVILAGYLTRWKQLRDIKHSVEASTFPDI